MAILFFNLFLAKGQIDEDVEASKIAGMQNGSGNYTLYIPAVKHPVSTFYRSGKSTWYDPDTNQATLWHF